MGVMKRKLCIRYVYICMCITKRTWSIGYDRYVFVCVGMYVMQVGVMFVLCMLPVAPALSITLTSISFHSRATATDRNFGTWVCICTSSTLGIFLGTIIYVCGIALRTTKLVYVW